MLRASFAKFEGVKRRFTITGKAGGITIVDDYAHHPVEIQATLKAALQAKGDNGKIIAVMQPHRYSRLLSLFNDFCKSFNDADCVIITDVYAAGEQPIEGASREALVEGVRAHGHRNVYGVQALARHRADDRRNGASPAIMSSASVRVRSADGPMPCRMSWKMFSPPRDDAKAGCLMAAAFFNNDLISRLPQARGKLIPDAPVGGTKPGFVSAGPLKYCSVRPMRKTWLFSWLIVPLISLSPSLAQRRIYWCATAACRASLFASGPPLPLFKPSGAELRIGAASIDLNVARAAQDAGIAGMEFLCGIPRYDRRRAADECRFLRARVLGYRRGPADVIERNGTRRTLTPRQIGFSYRHTDVADDLIFVSALLQGDGRRPGCHQPENAGNPEIARRLAAD